jgi:hypothetical protein
VLRTILLSCATTFALVCQARAQATENCEPVQPCDACTVKMPLCRLPQCNEEPRIVRIGKPRCVAETPTAVYPTTAKNVVGEHHCLTICAMRQAVKPAAPKAAPEKTQVAKAPAKTLRISAPPAPAARTAPEPVVRKPAPAPAPQIIVLVTNPCPTPTATEKTTACIQVQAPATPAAPCATCIKCAQCEPPRTKVVCTCKTVAAGPTCTACPQVASPKGQNIPSPVIRFGVDVPEALPPIRTLPDPVPAAVSRNAPIPSQGNYGAVRFDASSEPAMMPAITAAPTASMRTVVGQVAHFRKNWHLRYSGVETDDEFGGSVVLSGSNLDQLRDGQMVRVTGIITATAGRSESATMEIRAIEVLGVGP